MEWMSRQRREFANRSAAMERRCHRRRSSRSVPPPPLAVVLFLACIVARASCDDNVEASAEALEQENEQLKERLKLLQEHLKDEEQFSYVVTRGYIAGAENVYMETMEVANAKQWCNSNPGCYGFTFLGGSDGEQQPDDEVTVTFKGPPEPGTTNLDVEPDQAYVSYVKHTNSASILGHVGDAGMQLEGSSAALVGHWIGFSSAGLLFVLGLAGTVACRHRCRRSTSQGSAALLPGPR
jgi:hypothetical protein